jgi:lipopolysaccharide/colanic/teichoic acid biosynthesis glycosyltransferase
LLTISVMVKATSEGPVFFRAPRVGRNGRPFALFKFRTMVANAYQSGPAITAAHDQRITRVGQTLRHHKLDELPQLLNVLKGDMSLVGPRPEDPSYVARYTPEQRSILGARPGMTSPASLRYRDEETLLEGEDWQEHYLKEVMPAKLAIDSAYLKDRTVFSDIRVILETVTSLVRRDERP